MNEEHTYKGSKTKNYFSAYLLASEKTVFGNTEEDSACRK